MALVRCDKHGPVNPNTTANIYVPKPFFPAAHPNSGMICGIPDCQIPGLAWLTTMEDRLYIGGTRVFPLSNTQAAKIQLK
jgi:hypothetical protein